LIMTLSINLLNDKLVFRALLTLAETDEEKTHRILTGSVER
jgi:hypothetical protein